MVLRRHNVTEISGVGQVAEISHGDLAAAQEWVARLGQVRLQDGNNGGQLALLLGDDGFVRRLAVKLLSGEGLQIELRQKGD